MNTTKQAIYMVFVMLSSS